MDAQAFASLSLDGAATPLSSFAAAVRQEVLAKSDGVPGEVLDNLTHRGLAAAAQAWLLGEHLIHLHYDAS